ncbi:MAG: hypothetical protein ACO3UN_06870 [Candidatus Puniceispirillaceae bacterium]
MAVICYSEFTSIAGADYLVEIWDNATGTSPVTAYNLCKARIQAAGGYLEGDQCLIDSLAALAGTTQLTAAGEGFEIQRDGEGDTFHDNPIRASRANAYFVATTDAELALFTDIATDPEQTYACKIYRNNEFIYVGRVLADQMRFQRADPDGKVIVEVASVDVLALLKNYDVQESWFTDDHINGVDLFLNCLALTELDDYFSATQSFLFDGLRQYETSTQSVSSEKLNTFWFNRLAFVNSFDVFGGIQLDYVTAFDALQSVLDGFGARLYHENGAFHIIQPAAYQSATLVFHRYDKTGGYNGTQTVTHALALASLPSRPQWAAKPDLYYQPPFRYAKSEFTKQNGIYTKRDLFSSANFSLTFDRPLQDHNFRVQINLESAKLSTPNAYHNLWLRIYGFDGVLYYYYDGIYWQSQVGIPAFRGQPYYSTGTALFGVPTTVVVDFNGPIATGPAANITEFTVECYVQEIVPSYWSSKFGGSWTPATFTNLDFIGSIAVSRAYNVSSPGVVDEFKQDRFSLSENSLSGNSIPKTINNIFYDELDGTEAGSIMVGATYAASILPVSWAVGWETGYSNTFQQVVLDTAIAIYSDFKKVIRGTWLDAGSLTATNSLNFDSGTWLLNGVQWSANSEQWQGEWIEIAANYGDVIDTGEGDNYRPSERTYFENQVESLRARMNLAEETLGALPTQLINAYMLEAEGAPTADPGADNTYSLALGYDATTAAFSWQMRQMGAHLNVTSDIGVGAFPTQYEIFTCDTSGGSITINLPDPPSVTPGLRFGFIKTQASNSLTLDSGLGNLINDARLLSWNAKWETYWVQSDGTQWYIVASNK